MATVAAQVTATGITAPDFADILQELRILFWTIYGSDADLDDDTQDGQFLGALAQILYDSNQMAVAVYNAFSPASAQGVGLSSVVKINGIRRAVATSSQAPVLVIGQAGTQIENGRIGDNLGLGTVWTLPALVIIPVEGQITVTATAVSVGSTTATENTLTEILTATRGWQSVTNTSDATLGEPVEMDATLRVRQSRSVALPALTVIDSIFAALTAIPGVGRLTIYENDTDIANADGIPPHSVSVVVSGGDVTKIAEAIALEKSPGTGTHGTTSVVILDSRGVPNTIRFYELTAIALDVEIDIHPLPGYVSTTGNELVQAVVDFVNNELGIGEDSYLTRLYTPTNLGGVGVGATFVVTAVRQSRHGNLPTAANVAIAFNEAATLLVAQVTLTLV